MRRDEVRPQRKRSLPVVSLTRNQSQDIYERTVSEENRLAQELVFQARIEGKLLQHLWMGHERKGRTLSHWF
jgi:hypothetical protein